MVCSEFQAVTQRSINVTIDFEYDVLLFVKHVFALVPRERELKYVLVGGAVCANTM